MSMIDTIIPVILVALLSVMGNILYFEHRHKRVHNKDILEKRLTNLLLPLYTVLKSDELEFSVWISHSDLDPYDFESEKPERLLKALGDIIKENLYLADEELHFACVTFIEWAYQGDSYRRFQELHSGEFKRDADFEKFREVVYRKYNETKAQFLMT